MMYLIQREHRAIRTSKGERRSPKKVSQTPATAIWPQRHHGWLSASPDYNEAADDYLITGCTQTTKTDGVAVMPSLNKKQQINVLIMANI
jgi:hypothetical protein